MLPETLAVPEAVLLHDFSATVPPMLARKELPGSVGDRGLSCSSYTGGGIAALEDCERGRESSS